jgi:hypothetical protein
MGNTPGFPNGLNPLDRVPLTEEILYIKEQFARFELSTIHKMGYDDLARAWFPMVRWGRINVILLPGARGRFRITYYVGLHPTEVDQLNWLMERVTDHSAFNAWTLYSYGVVVEVLAVLGRLLPRHRLI